MQQKKHSKEIKLHSQLLRWDNESVNRKLNFIQHFVHSFTMGRPLNTLNDVRNFLFESNSVTDLDFTALWIHFGSQYCRKMS